MKITRLIGLCILPAAITACGGGSGGAGGSPPPPPPPAATHSVALTGVQVDRAADQAAVDIGGLPVEGATVTVD